MKIKYSDRSWLVGYIQRADRDRKPCQRPDQWEDDKHRCCNVTVPADWCNDCVQEEAIALAQFVLHLQDESAGEGEAERPEPQEG